jgi:hypothetical protein
VKAFCHGKRLWSLVGYPRGEDAIERVFFGYIDDRAAVAADTLVSGGPKALSLASRIDFTRFLHSLEYRRPDIMARLHIFGEVDLPSGMDSDPEILEALAAKGIEEAPSQWYQKATGENLRNRAVMMVQDLVDSPSRGQQVINWCWGVVTLPDGVPDFCTSDRPLIRTAGTDSPTVAWVLPLTPRVAFVATSAEQTLSLLRSQSAKQLVRRVNAEQVVNADRFVFTRKLETEAWLAKRLRHKGAVAL